MAELAYKRRLRDRKRRITTTLEAQGYKVRTFESGPFHLQACRGKTGLAIRITFGDSTADEVRAVSREPLPDRCLREIWQVDQSGRVTVRAKVSENMSTG